MILKKLQHLYKSDSNYAIVARTFLVNGLVYGLNFITFILVARILGPDERGKLVYISLISMFLSALLSFGLMPTVKFILASKKEKLNEIFVSSILFVLGLNVVMISLVVLLWQLQFLGKIGNELDWKMISYFCGLIFITNFFSLFYNIALGESLYDFSNRFTLLRNAAVIPSMLILVVVFSFRLEGAVVAHIISYVFACLYFLFILYKKYSFLPVVKWSLLRKHYHFSSNVWLASMATSFNSRFDQYIVALFISGKDLGLYSAAVQFADQILFVPNATDHVFFNKTAQNKDAEARITFFERFMSIMIGFTVCFGLLYTIACYFLIPILLGPEFDFSKYIFLWYAAGVILWIIPKYFLKFFTGSDMIKISSTIIFWNSLFMLAAYPILGYYFGILGIAAFSILSSVFCGVLCMYFFKKHTGQWPKLSIRHILNFREVFSNLRFK